jgi:hypothetical protein
MTSLFFPNSGNKIRISLWGPALGEIGNDLYNNLGPFVIVVTSTIVKTFKGKQIKYYYNSIQFKS